jgi:hypothetical protein
MFQILALGENRPMADPALKLLVESGVRTNTVFGQSIPNDITRYYQELFATRS